MTTPTLDQSLAERFLPTYDVADAVAVVTDADPATA